MRTTERRARMSYQAMFEVTRALRQFLYSQIATVLGTARVTLHPPGDTLPQDPGVNLYLYRVAESPFSANRPWPGDRSTRTSNRPSLALELHYLLTALGKPPDDADVAAGDIGQTMLGAAMLALHEHPVLNDVHLPGFDADVVLPQFLRDSFETIKVCLAPLGLEEIAKVWSTINQPYRLSVAYQVSVVELAPTPPPPITGGFVQRTGVTVIGMDPPRLQALSPASGALATTGGGPPATTGGGSPVASGGGPLATAGAGTLVPNSLEVRGFGLSFPGQTPLVRVGGEPVLVQTIPPPTDNTLVVTMPLAPAGGPQVDVSVTLNGRTSRPLPFSIAPWLAALLPVRTTLDNVALTLQGSGFRSVANPQAVRLDGPGGMTMVRAFAAGGTNTETSVRLPVGLANGLYEVRLVLGDPAGSASNPRILEVLPLLSTVAATVVSGFHQLTLSGARLNGADVRLVVDGGDYQTGANQNASTLVFQLGRMLTPGPHSVALDVDGHRSHTVQLNV